MADTIRQPPLAWFGKPHDALGPDIGRPDRAHLRQINNSYSFAQRAAAHRANMREFVDTIIRELASLPAERYAHTPLLGRIWELRHNFTAHDAVYIALAEETNAVLYTTDSKLRTGHRARVRLLA
jgi:predicted nucleic acid-binding protein